jgi:hypothetical protein
MSGSGGRDAGRPAGALVGVALALAVALLPAGCGAGGSRARQAPAQKRFPSPIFDGLALGMRRDEVARLHPIRPALTSAGKTRLVWVCERPGDYAADLTFSDPSEESRLNRIDVHFGPSDESPDRFIDRFRPTLGEPEVLRRKADINAYGDRSHEQYETIWSDATQYVFLTERVPLGSPSARPAYFLTVKKKEITATGPPTGYVPPPPPKGKDGKPVEESPF